MLGKTFQAIERDLENVINGCAGQGDTEVIPSDGKAHLKKKKSEAMKVGLGLLGKIDVWRLWKYYLGDEFETFSRIGFINLREATKKTTKISARFPTGRNKSFKVICRRSILQNLSF